MAALVWVAVISPDAVAVIVVEPTPSIAVEKFAGFAAYAATAKLAQLLVFGTAAQGLLTQVAVPYTTPVEFFVYPVAANVAPSTVLSGTSPEVLLVL